VPRRASLPGADELFRRTSSEKPRSARTEPEKVDKATKLQVASTDADSAERKAPRHEEKVTFYCTADDLMQLERARLSLRSDHGIGADRGRIVRAALDYVLEDFEARGDDSILLRQLSR
jgi:hypothetical protein